MSLNCTLFPSASAILMSLFIEMFSWPVSIREMTLWSVFVSFARSSCVIFFSSRAWAISIATSSQASASLQSFLNSSSSLPQ